MDGHTGSASGNDHRTVQNHAETIVVQQDMKPVVDLHLTALHRQIPGNGFWQCKCFQLPHWSARCGPRSYHTPEPRPLVSSHRQTRLRAETIKVGFKVENLTEPTLLDRRTRSQKTAIRRQAVFEIPKEAVSVSMPTR